MLITFLPSAAAFCHPDEEEGGMWWLLVIMWMPGLLPQNSGGFTFSMGENGQADASTDKCGYVGGQSAPEQLGSNICGLFEESGALNLQKS